MLSGEAGVEKTGLWSRSLHFCPDRLSEEGDRKETEEEVVSQGPWSSLRAAAREREVSNTWRDTGQRAPSWLPIWGHLLEALGGASWPTWRVTM
ncbi:hypothetical protein DF277_15730 [Listeria monocytogenes]|nr:hypothetical protein DF277_15730 [Listeria monocytogenes]